MTHLATLLDELAADGRDVSRERAELERLNMQRDVGYTLVEDIAERARTFRVSLRPFGGAARSVDAILSA